MVVGIIGTQWGLFLGRELQSFYHGPLVVCGTDQARTHRAAVKLDALECTWNWRRVRDHPSVSHVILAVPPELNREICTDLLRAGKNVLVEKPLACNLEDCDAIIHAAIQSRSVLAVGENIPFRPVIREARRHLAEIGKPRLLVASSIHGARFKNPGILLDFAVHYIRAVRILFGEPDTVFASRAQNITTNSDDNATIILGSRAGWKAVINVSWQASAGISPEFVITGTHGALKVWPASTSLDIYPRTPTSLTQWIAGIRPTSLRQLLESPETQRRRIHCPRQDKMGYRAELRDFLEMTAGNVNSAIEARADIAVVMAAYRSIESGREQGVAAA